ncbi:hypothetical protein B0H17DRAFT_1336955 [Mycena rosella]|uniref:Novel STAND NTPase 1 domain-containing protein n=1 Tax=Mycena rosella TaxID=1033263 RepID=A0AAD7G5Y7_MYCRO|nr:hypothetical protein B0H17DRAFT_1336955 [Mycena rosella]
MLGSSRHIPRAAVGAAAATLKQLSEISPIPYIKVVAGVSLLILDTVQSVKTNKEECTAMIVQIDQLLHIMIDLCSEPSVSLPSIVLDAIGKFAETLQKIEVFMRMQNGMGRFKRFFRHQENIAQLEDCKTGLKAAFDAFSMKGSLATAGDLAEMRLAMDHRHHELLEMISDSYSFNQGSSVSSASSRDTLSINDSFSSLSLMLPSAPQIFHGRDSELAAVVNLLLQDAPRVAILGTGGIGKTCLAKSALHHPDVVAKYPDRYFVSCESAGTVEDLAVAVAAALGLELSGKLSKVIVKHLSARSSCLVLVLDNFETPWEPLASRSKVDEFLSVLADFDLVALVVTMRGQERPLKIRWTRPFIPTLKPLSFDAAHKTFLDISDADSDEDAPHVAELLALTGNLPLAVTLMATVVSFDGCQSVLSRWKTENVSLLSDGFRKETNIETSLRISLSSPRMTSSPGALQLLSVLSLLPDGMLDVDLIKCPIPDLPRCKSTLLRTALAYIDTERLKVLAPVRELIRKLHPPPHILVRPLRWHWNRLIKLWRMYEMPSGNLVQRLAGNAGNITGILKYELDVGAPELKEVVYGIFDLNAFSSRTYSSPSLLMDDIATNIDRVDDNKLHGYYICHRFNEAKPITPAEALDLIAQGSQFFQLAGDLAEESRLQHTIVNYYIRVADINNASMHADIALSLADQADDNVRRHHALCALAMCSRIKGQFRESLELAQRAQWFAGRIGNFQRETEALEEEAAAWMGLGNFSQAVKLCGQSRQLLIAYGLEGTSYEIRALDLEADQYLCKTAYQEARRAYEHIVRNSSLEKCALFHGNSLLGIASVNVIFRAFESEAEVAAALKVPRQIFTAHGYLRGLPVCDRVLADFYLTSGRTQDAAEIYEKCARSSRGESAESLSACMLKLGDITLRNDLKSTTRWATAYLAHGKTTLSPSVMSWAFRLLGDIFRNDGDDETSGALFQVALEEFTRMGIYLGRAQCLLRLAELAENRGERTVATEHFSDARRMFLKSGMIMEAEQVPVDMRTNDEPTSKWVPDTVIGANDTCSQCAAPSGLKLFTSVNWGRFLGSPASCLKSKLKFNSSIFQALVQATAHIASLPNQSLFLGSHNAVNQAALGAWIAEIFDVRRAPGFEVADG